MQKVSLVVPIYKKGDIIEKCINKQLEVLEEVCNINNLDYELIAIVDGILDHSVEELKKINNPKFHVYAYKHNRGKGFAVRYGMMKATGDYIGFIDGGIDLDPICIQHLITNITTKNVHIVVGSKKHTESNLVYPLKRKIFTKVFSIFSYLFTGINYLDSQVGAKLFTRELIDKILPRILVKRYAFDVELLCVATLLGYKEHIDIPVNIDFEADETTGINLKQIFRMVWDTLAISYRLKILHYYDDKNHLYWAESLYDLIYQKTLLK